MSIWQPTPGGPCRWTQSTRKEFERVYPPHRHSDHFQNWDESPSPTGQLSRFRPQVMQWNKHVLLLLCKAPALTAQVKIIVGLIKFVRYVTTQNRYQRYILRLGIMLQVYNSSLPHPSSWFSVEKSRSHWHDRSSFIVYPFSLRSRTKPPNQLSLCSRIQSIFQHDNKLIAQKIVQQWSQLNGMTDESLLSLIAQQHVDICLDCHESYRP